MRNIQMFNFGRLSYPVLFFLLFPLYISAQNDDPVPFQDHLENMRRETNAAFLQAKAQRDSARFVQEQDSAHRLALRLGYPAFKTSRNGDFALQGFDDGGQLQYYGTDNAISAAAIRTSELYPGGNAELNLTGAGWTFAVWEISRPRTTHVEFNNRITPGDNSTQSIGDHATHVSGTLIASGANSDARGMAYEANLVAFDADNDVSEMAAAAGAGLRVSNHSYGSISGWEYDDYSGQLGWHWFGNTSISQATDYKFGLYDSRARDYDDVAFNAPFYLPVKSAGNDRNDTGPAPGGQHWVKNASNQWVSSFTPRNPDGGANGYDCIATYGTAKNALTVGAVEASAGSGFLVIGMADFTSWGPTDDGRIKPDIMARGVNVFSPVAGSNFAYDNYSGTSMATPSVTGSLTLLLQHYSNLNPGFTIRASALKALVLHTANQFGAGQGPNYRSGWGLMDTRAAADFISHSFISESRDRLYSRDSIANGDVRERTYYHDGEVPFQATVVWTDPAGPVSANTLNPTQPRLVNDLDVRLVRASDGAVFYPWRLDPAAPAAAATKGDNFRDNVEQIYESNLPPGIYTVRVSHKGALQGGVQFFSMMVSGRSSLYYDCSGTINDGSGSGNYLNNSYYSWTISPPNAASITLNFSAFDTEFDYDFVRVYDGTSSNDPLLGEFSGSTLPPALTANSGSMFIVFDSDESVTKGGWSATYSCTQPQLTVSPGSLNFGANGGSSNASLTANCTWSVGNLPSWLSVTPNSGSANANLSISCSSNMSQSSRMATIQITGCNGLSQTITVNQAGCTLPVGPVIVNNGASTLCPGQTALLSATNVCSGCTVSWSNGQTGASISVNSAGTYTAQYANACGTGPASNGISVTSGTAPAAPAITANGSTSLCTGQSVTLTATDVCSGCTVSWSNGQTGASISVNSAGTYTAQYANACGTGPASNGISVTSGTAPAAPAITANGSTSLCTGQSVTLTATDVCSGCTVSWSNGQTGASISVNSAGTYTAQYANACGTGPASNGISVTSGTAPAAPAITANGSTSLCTGQSVTLTATDVCSGCTVSWSNGQTGASISVNSAGTYTAQYANACGTGPASNGISVTSGTAPAAPAITANGSTSLCTGQSVTLTATDVCSGCTVSWSNGQTGASISVNSSGTYTAQYANACGTGPASNGISVTSGTAPAAPAITANGSTSLCTGQSVTLTATDVCSGCTVSWSNGQTGASISVNSAGTYTAQYANACGTGPASNGISVTSGTAPAAPAITVNGSTSLCIGQSVTLTATDVCSGCTVSWSNGQTGASISVNSAGTYTAQYTNACGTGPASNGISVTSGTAPAAPAITVNGSTSLCNGQSVTLTATDVCSGCTVSWSNGQTGPVVMVNTAGTYTAQYTNLCGMGPASNPIMISVNPDFSPVIQVNNGCYLAAPAGSGYQWYLNGSAISDATGQFWTAQLTGYYTVSMLSPAGCPGVSQPLFAEACASGTANLPDGVSMQLFPNPALDRIWMNLESGTSLINVRLELFGMDGRFIGSLFQGDLPSDETTIEIALPMLPAGIYMYRMISEKGILKGQLAIGR